MTLQQLSNQLCFETVLIESLFSAMNYNKDKKRESVCDKSVATMHTIDVAKVISIMATPSAATDLVINIKRLLEHRLKLYNRDNKYQTNKMLYQIGFDGGILHTYLSNKSRRLPYLPTSLP